MMVLFLLNIPLASLDQNNQIFMQLILLCFMFMIQIWFFELKIFRCDPVS